jgi:rhodanese-related sulfurtransferase
MLKGRLGAIPAAFSFDTLESGVAMEIDVGTAKGWMDAGKGDQDQSVFFLDCREPSEHQTASIDRVTLAPMSQWPPSQELLKQMQGKQVVVLCHHGGRSLRVVHWLRANGYPSAVSMAGGIDRWSLEIDPSVPRY